MRNYDETVSGIMDYLKSETKTETVFGKQFIMGEFTCVPVIQVGVGQFSTYTPDPAKQTYTEGEFSGLNVEPIGFLVIRKNQINYISSNKPSTSKGLTLPIDTLPEIIGNYFEATRSKNQVYTA